MYKYEKKNIEINGNILEFEYDIRDIILYKDNYIILLEIPFNKTDINNIYCLDSQANLVWQAEDLAIVFPELKNLLPYEQMGVKDDFIFASDFYGRNFKINADNGQVIEINIVK